MPWVKAMCSEAFSGKELSTTLNADECVAKGCALQAAILSPNYKVREFKVEEKVPYAVSVSWTGSGSVESKDGEVAEAGEDANPEGQLSTAPLFPATSMMNALKVLTFHRKMPFEVKVQYTEPKRLLSETPAELGNYKVELPPQAEAKKIKVRAKVNLNGIFSVEGAQLVEQEEYEEMVKERVELPPSPENIDVDAPADDSATKAASEEKPAESEAPEKVSNGQEATKPDTNGKETNGETDKLKPEVVELEEKEGEAEVLDVDDDEIKEPPKKMPRYQWIEVVKKKTRTKKTDVPVKTEGIPGLGPDALQKRMDEETAMQVEMREVVETNDKKNELEAYVLQMREKCSERGEYGPYITGSDRVKFTEELQKAEDWVLEAFDEKKLAFIEKLDELKRTGDTVAWRCKEDGMRKDWIEAVQGTLRNYRAAAEEPGDKYSHIDKKKLDKIVTACNALEKWLSDSKAKQEALAKHDKPVLLCADMEKKNQELARMADEILREPKPAPPPPPEAPKEAEPPKVSEEVPKQETAEEQKEASTCMEVDD